MISCYLDSQDYSALTDPKLQNLDRDQIKDDLLHLARSNQVRFAFSAAAVSESVSLTADATHLAELKADFLSKLCGSNALVSFDRLVGAEVLALSRRTAPPRDMFDPKGRWFPEIPVDKAPEQPWARMREMAEEEMRAMGLSRQERRAKSRALIKNGKPRQALQAHLSQQDPTTLAAELLHKYPMLPEYAEIVGRYALGRATETDFEEALMDSLSDPHWMMKWFSTEHAMSSPIAEIIRKPGRELGQLMRALASTSMHWVSALRDAGFEANPTGKGGEIALCWQEMEERQLISVAQRIANAKGLELGKYEARDVETCCPGIATGVRSLYSSVWANVGEGRREEPSDSQPVDALHAFYAPYVQVFRADRFMAPHIQKHVGSTSTIVVPRLSQLVGVLEKQLR